MREGGKVVDRAGGRGPGVLYQSLTAALLLVIALVAITAARDVPPAIAELAPQAVEQIKEAPDEHASEGVTGSDPGRGGEGGAPTTTTTTTTATSVNTPTKPSVYTCIGDPPRQIEDPQSPPCVPFWDEAKGNGGKTSFGVTADEITVAAARWEYNDGSAAFSDDEYKLLEDFFNKRFQFYGRRLRIVPYTPSYGMPTADQMEADAEVVKEIGAFATFSYPERNGTDYIYWDALARRKIIGIGPASNYTGYSTEADFTRNRPYQWSYLPGWDRLQRSTAEFICKQLNGYPPRYAKGRQALPAKRKFGIVQEETRADLPSPSIAVLKQALQDCGAPFTVKQWNPRTGAQSVQQLDSEGVTTILFNGHTSGYSVHFSNAATAQGFTPEFLVWNNGHQDDDEAGEYYRTHADSVFGVQAWNRTLPLEHLPSTWAVKEINPGAEAKYHLEYIYKPLLLLASGIQMAGPKLTPETFEQGLFRTRFPNPGAGAAPYYQGWVGFPGGLHTMLQDQTRIWLGRNEVSPATGRPPAYCYVDKGARFRIGGWPEEEGVFFEGPCR